LFDRIHKGQAALVRHPPDDIAMRPAAKAVIEALFIIDGETGRLFMVERATGLELTPRLGHALVRP
jgi:hypothetical protein